MAIEEILMKLNHLKKSVDEFDENDLAELSGLNTIEINTFIVWWLKLKEETKIKFLKKLNFVAEDNFELEFYEILQFTLTDLSPQVRKESINGLWECQDYRIADLATDILLNDVDASVRIESSKLLRKFCHLIKDGKLSGRISAKIIDSVNLILEKSNMDSELWRRTMESSACFNTDALDEYINIAYQSENTILKSSAIFAMGESDNIKWVNIVISAVYNDLPEIRYESAVALGKLGDESTLQNLQELLNDEDIQVKNRAIESIGAIGGAMAKRILLSMINEDSESKESLELALENIEV